MIDNYFSNNNIAVLQYWLVDVMGVLPIAKRTDSVPEMQFSPFARIYCTYVYPSPASPGGGTGGAPSNLSCSRQGWEKPGDV
jgi:hypothetical protein